MTGAATAQHMPRHADQIERRRGAEMLARAGYLAHGLVYALVAVFALDAAFGGGEQAQGARSAVSQIAHTGWGTALLGVLAFGLLFYSLMRLWQGFADPAGHGKDARGIGKRIGRVASGIAQLALAFYVATLAFDLFSGAGGGGGSGGGDQATGLTAQVMGWPGGRWIIGAIGLGICIAAIQQAVHAYRADFMNDLSPEAQRKAWVRKTGRFGYAARVVVFGVIGGLLIAAAVRADPDKAEGLGGALRTLQDQAYGPWLLGLTAAGLLAFAITRAVFARYLIVPLKD